MEILVVSYFYFPENTPRAFRAHELVKEFDRRGYNVTLVLPNKEAYRKNSYSNNIEVHYVGGLISDTNKKPSSLGVYAKKIKELIFAVKYYFLPFSFFPGFIDSASQKIAGFQNKFDVIFSNSFPFVTHLSLHKALNKNRKLRESTLKIAEYSDPFSKQKHKKVLFIYNRIERKVLKDFDVISIPTEKAISAYTSLKSKENIHVLPQAFDLHNQKLKQYNKNGIPTFAYAGMFYSGLRDPSFLFEYLAKLDQDFLFVVYSRFSNDIFIKKYQPILKDKLQIKINCTREEIIQDLAQYDFLINVDNDSSNQLPSKLIDYAISDRPIFSASSETFSKEKFNSFLKGEYENKLEVDLSKHDIRKVVDKLLRIAP